MMMMRKALLPCWVGAASALVGPSSLLHTRRSTLSFATKKQEETKKIPIHLLAGFLGSGKTTTLSHILLNKENRRIGVIVNDVAAINIDAKLVKSTVDGVVQLQNGCACCSIADELLTSVEQLLRMGDKNNVEWDAIVVELSGVADPVAVQNHWKTAVKKGLEVTNEAALSNVITVVDASTFGSNYMTWDTAGDRWQDEGDECSTHRKIGELLAEQVEAASTIVFNKLDLADTTQLEIATKLAKSLNQKADVITTSFGKITVSQILPDAAKCEDPGCTDASHSHSHEDHHAASCEDVDCTDASHSHSSHDHNHAATTTTCEDVDCTDTSHSHSHDHAATCEDADCTDSSHSHSHNNHHGINDLGITNFVYTATRPFDANRLMVYLYQWPVPIKDNLMELDNLYPSDAVKKDGASPFLNVLRSKGFCWIAPTCWNGVLQDTWRHTTAMYWSHAGKHMGITEAGRWWASVPDAQMREFFNRDEYERVKREDFVSTEFGDRRQELVFIGINVQEDAIRAALDDCLLSDHEMQVYRENVAQLEVTTVEA